MVLKLMTNGLLVLALLLSSLVWAEGFQYEEGTHYVRLDKPVIRTLSRLPNTFPTAARTVIASNR
jgi:hypothetical protein